MRRKLGGRFRPEERGEEGAEKSAGEVDAGVGDDTVATGNGELGGFVENGDENGNEPGENERGATFLEVPDDGADGDEGENEVN